MILKKFFLSSLLVIIFCTTPVLNIGSITFFTSCTTTQCAVVQQTSKDISVSLNKTSVNLDIGKTIKLKLNGTTESIKWKSANKNIASVNQKGKVKAISKGKTVIKAITSQKTYKCKLIVSNPSEKKFIYNSIIAYKKTYPEGTSWTNSNYYKWNGGVYTGGYGCAGFAFMLSDAAFGTKKAHVIYDLNNIQNTIRVGDIIRVNYDSHSVIVLKKYTDCVEVAEGNYNSSVHWGRKISYEEIKSSGTYYMTRYDN